MTNLKYVNDREFYVFHQSNIKVEINGPIKKPHKLVIHNQNTEKKVAWEFELTSGELKELGEMMLRAAELTSYKIKRAEEEAHLLMKLDVPLNYIITHLNKTYKSNKEYGKFLKDQLLEILDFRQDEDYENDRKVEWFNQLNNLFKETDLRVNNTYKNKSQKISMQSTKLEYDGFDDVYETESDFWKRNAEDSDMTLEEYFNSMD